MVRHAVSITLLMLVLAASAAAHEFWIAPTTFRPIAGSIVGLHLRVGHLHEAETFPRSEGRIEKFVVVEPSGEVKDVKGRKGAAPAGLIRVTDEGLYIAGYRSLPSPITLEADKFEAYLREEGLERIAEERARLNETQSPGRERFSRAAKAILAVGADPRSAPGFDRSLGFRLELIPEANPYGLKPADELPLRLVFEEAPLEGALIRAARAEDPTEVISARTDSSGRVRLALPHAGHWLITTVHMVRVHDSAEADWESVWASLTFAVEKPAEPAPPEKTPADGDQSGQSPG